MKYALKIKKAKSVTPTRERGKHWDLAFSCYEPLDRVTGGIGTYTRLLMQILADDPTLVGKRIAFFCRSATADIILPGRGGDFEVFQIPDNRLIYDKPANRLGNDHDFFSWNLAHHLADMTAKGHTFGLFEFPDYAVEGYFPLKLRRAGLIAIESVAIRLHSPELMLFRDNLLPSRLYDTERLTRMSRELFCYQHCDKVLYGAPEMLKRVSIECERFGVVITNKAIQVEHPYPVASANAVQVPGKPRKDIHIGYVGRMEVRKGILRFLSNIAGSALLRQLVHDLDIVFELFGADCTDAYGKSVRSQILHLQHVPELRGRIVLHGYLSQKELRKKTALLDGFVFPSLFENYPNALLEVLHTTAPILISNAGGMPYISRGLPGIEHFAYDSNFENNVAQFLCSIRPASTRPAMYLEFADRVNAGIAAKYADLSKQECLKTPVITAEANIDFVVPFYNDSAHVEQCLSSLKIVMADNDALYIMDDCSKPDEVNALKKAIIAVFGNDKRVHMHRMPMNSGPSAARNAGVMLGSNPLIQFLDADDHMNRLGFNVTRRYIQSNSEVDFVYGVLDNFEAAHHIWVPRDASAMTCLEENYTHCGILIKRSVFVSSGGFDAGMRLHYEDWQFNCRLALAGYRGEMIPYVTVHYRVRDGSRTFRNTSLEAFSREQVIDRSCTHRGHQATMLDGELLELIGKYSNMIHGRWTGGDQDMASDEHLVVKLSLSELCDLDGTNFITAAYGTILGRGVDEVGLRYYMSRLEKGGSKKSIIADLMTSSEMRQKGRTVPKGFSKGLRMERFVRHPVIKKFMPLRVLS